MNPKTSGNVGKRFKNINDLKLIIPPPTFEFVELKTTSPYLYFDVRDREVFNKDTSASFSPIENVNSAYVSNDEYGRHYAGTFATLTEENDNIHSYDSKRDALSLSDNFSKGTTVSPVPTGRPQNIDSRKIAGQTQSSNRRRRDKTTLQCLSIRKALVLLGAFSIILLSSFPFNISVIYVEIREMYGASNAETSLVQSVTIGVFLGLGFISGLIVKRFGLRNTGIFSGILMSIGLSVNYFATGIPFMVVTLGVMSGMGFSMLSICAMASIGNEVFGKITPFALSIASFGAGVGSMMVPYITMYLMDEYNVQGTFLIIGAAALNIIPAVLLCTPKEKENKRTNALHSESAKNICCMLKLQDMRDRISQILKHKLFLFFVISITLTISSLQSLFIFFIDIFKLLGMSSSETRFLFLIYAIMSSVGRIIPGLTKFIPHVSVLLFPAIIAGMGCISVALLPLATTHRQFVTIVSFYGLACGSAFAIFYIVTQKLVGSDNYTVGIGVLMSVNGIGIMAGGPISGAIRDISGDYSVLCQIVSTTLGISSVMFIIASLWRQRILKSKEETEINTHL